MLPVWREIDASKTTGIKKNSRSQAPPGKSSR
jgi:hypothetical protein